jgi:signal recognition particle subunit SRP54
MFEALSERFTNALTSLRRKGRISESDIEEITLEIQGALLEADVSLRVATDFAQRVSEIAKSELTEIQRKTNQADEVYRIINNQLIEILGGQARRIRFAKNPPTVIMLAGLQGSGKTTFAGKLAKYLKEQGNTPILVAADLQRPNAVTQLSTLANSVNVPVFAPEPGNGQGDPVSVAKLAIEHAKKKLFNLVIIDTAGRLGVDSELMDEAKRIKEVAEPDEVLFVVDSMIGQDAVNTAKAFEEGVGIDGVVLTKLDGDAKGGAALSIVETIKKPIIFTSTGEKLTDIDYFYPDRMASRILGLGDIATLAEQAKQSIDENTAKRLEEKFVSGESFTLEDFLEQIQAMQKMGSMTKILGMLPGANSAAMKKQMAALDDNELIKTRAIVQSMTPAERIEPKILNGSRRLRIANGSGRTVSEVNNLVERFSAAQKMMKQMRSGNPIPNPGLGLPAKFPPMGLGPKPSANKPVKKSKSGNPAKRALEEGR